MKISTVTQQRIYAFVCTAVSLVIGFWIHDQIWPTIERLLFDEPAVANRGWIALGIALVAVLLFAGSGWWFWRNRDRSFAWSLRLTPLLLLFGAVATLSVRLILDLFFAWI